MKDLLKFEIRNKKKLGKYLLFGIALIIVLALFGVAIEYGMSLINNVFLHKFKSKMLLAIVGVITTVMLAMQMGKTNEFESTSMVGISERKERGIFLYISRATVIGIMLLYLLCICY